MKRTGLNGKIPLKKRAYTKKKPVSRKHAQMHQSAEVMAYKIGDIIENADVSFVVGALCHHLGNALYQVSTDNADLKAKFAETIEIISSNINEISEKRGTQATMSIQATFVEGKVVPNGFELQCRKEIERYDRMKARGLKERIQAVIDRARSRITQN
jgi:hypothetical protein